MTRSRARVAVVFRGDPGARLNIRLEPMAEALIAAGATVEPVAVHAHHADETVRRLAHLGRGDGVLVWADPLADDGDRSGLDTALREAESAGAWVSARPAVSDRLGTKEVLVTTRDLGWGSDAHRYGDRDQ